MSENLDIWEMREVLGGLTLELLAGRNPSLVLVQDENRIGVDLSNVKGLVAALTDTAADLAEVLAAGGVYHG